MTEPSEQQHLKEIDCLKGIAILFVVCIHAKFLEGTVFFTFVVNRAVPIFLVLLGMTLDLSLRRSTGGTLRERLTRFYGPRFRRLYPPYWLSVGAWWGLLVLLVGVNPERHLLEIGLSAIGFAPWMGTTWFVALVLQVILTFPLLRYLYDRLGPFVMLPIGATASTLSVLHVFDIVAAGRKLYQSTAIPVDFYYQWIFSPRVWWHVLGGVWLVRFSRRYDLRVTLAALATILLVEPVVIWVIQMDDPMTVNEQVACYLFDLPLVVALLGLLHRARLPAALERFLVWAGRSSWGIYLGHILVFETVHLLQKAPEHGEQSDRALYFVALFASGALLTLALGSLRRRTSAVRPLPERAATS